MISVNTYLLKAFIESFKIIKCALLAVLKSRKNINKKKSWARTFSKQYSKFQILSKFAPQPFVYHNLIKKNIKEIKILTRKAKKASNSDKQYFYKLIKNKKTFLKHKTKILPSVFISSKFPNNNFFKNITSIIPENRKSFNFLLLKFQIW